MFLHSGLLKQCDLFTEMTPHMIEMLVMKARAASQPPASTHSSPHSAPVPLSTAWVAGSRTHQRPSMGGLTPSSRSSRRPAGFRWISQRLSPLRANQSTDRSIAGRIRTTAASPVRIVQCGQCGQGRGTRAVLTRYPQAKPVAAEAVVLRADGGGDARGRQGHRDVLHHARHGPGNRLSGRVLLYPVNLQYPVAQSEGGCTSPCPRPPARPPTC